MVRYHRGPAGPDDRGTFPLSVSQAQAASGAILARGRMRLMGWSLASVAVDTIQASGSFTTPGAGQVIASLVNPTANDLQVVWQVQLSGTPSGTDRNNFQLLNGANVVLASINGGAAGIFTQPNVVITVPAGGTVSIQAIAAATAGAVYSAQIVASVLAGGAIGQILDAGQVVGMTSTGADQLDTEWFGPDGVYVGTSIAVQLTSGALSGCLYVRHDPPEYEEDEPSPASLSSPKP